MPDIAVLVLFIPTIFLVSISPGMCMTLAMTLGLYVGIRRTLWMMLGELLGIALVAVSSVLSVAALTLKFPLLLLGLKVAGAGYLIYLGFQAWKQPYSLESSDASDKKRISRTKLIMQGFATAVSNPKSWAFMIALLPPLIQPEKSFLPQLTVFLIIILTSEFICMMIYASSGKALGRLFKDNGGLHWINKFTAILLIMVAIWLLYS